MVYHGKPELTDDIVHSPYGCPVDIIAGFRTGTSQTQVKQAQVMEGLKRNDKRHLNTDFANAMLAGIVASIVCGIIGVIIVEKVVMMSGGIHILPMPASASATFWVLNR